MDSNGQTKRGQGIYGLETLTYPEMPWPEDLAALSHRLAEVFPGAGRSDARTEEAHSDAAYPNGAGLNGASPANSARADDEHWAGLLAEEQRKAGESGRAEGLERGRALGREEMAHRLEVERHRLHAQATSLAESFAASRASYFHQVEEETVRLALAIAARILRREAQMDPLLLTGAVRVALGQLAESTSVRLRVPLQDQGLWEEALALIPRLASRPEVIGDSRLELGESRMETELGMADLGLWSQLKEIERGFFDRPGGAVNSADLREGADKADAGYRAAGPHSVKHSGQQASAGPRQESIPGMSAEVNA